MFTHSKLLQHDQYKPRPPQKNWQKCIFIYICMIFVWLIRKAFREVLHEEQVARQAEAQPVWSFESGKNQEKKIEQMFLVLVQCPWLKRLSKFHVWYFQITTRSRAAGVQPKLIEESSLFCEHWAAAQNGKLEKNIFGQTCQLLLSDLTN